jgi:hypothetical protein
MTVRPSLVRNWRNGSCMKQIFHEDRAYSRVAVSRAKKADENYRVTASPHLVRLE